jgi:hypothetical protein
MEDLTAIELAWLGWKYRRVEPDPCRVCGAPMTMAESGAGKTTYRCGSDAAHFLSKTSLPEKEKAQEHYRRSEQVIVGHGDALVLRAIKEIRETREMHGMDPYPEQGELHDPYNVGDKGKIRYKYLGQDRFEEVLLDYT